MTNEEAIKKDKGYLFEEFMGLIKDEFDERDEAYNLGVGECIDILTKCNFNNLSSVFQENTKLKAEIEELIKEVDYYKGECCLQSHINDELKSELEQSVKLPFPFGTEKVYIAYMAQGEINICELDCKKITVSRKSSGVIAYTIDSIELYESDFGVEAFLSLEEAEQALKGKVENGK